MDHPLGKPLTALACSGLLLAAVAGCSRALYRQKADRDAYAAIASKTEQLLGEIPLRAGSIEPFEDSRFFDPFDPDHAPMPPDDPLSHELMLEVDGHKGAKAWRASEEPSVVRSDAWKELLTKDASGAVILNLKSVMQLGVHNSRDFQREREDLYLSALDVTYDRFQFAPKFALGTGAHWRADGKHPPSNGSNGNQRSILTDGTVRWMAATGGELLASFANSFVWDFKKHGVTDTAGTLLNLSIVQPLMRMGGAQHALEALTQGERSLLANVRQMQQFQLGYYVKMIAGRTAGEGPNRNGPVGSAGLGLIAGNPSGRTVAPRADGFMGILEEAQRIENLESNVARLRESMEQLSAAFDAGRISSRLQVDQARLALFNSQSNLLSAKAAYQTKLDGYKIDLGLPPDLPVKVRDSFLERFSTSNPDATALDRRLSAVQSRVRAEGGVQNTEDLRRLSEELVALVPALKKILASASKDLASLRTEIPNREAQLRKLQQKPGAGELGVESAILDAASLRQRVDKYEKSAFQAGADVEKTATILQKFAAALDGREVEPARAELRDLASQLSGLLLSIALNQTATRLESATLPKVEITEAEALEIARENRLDWMNARARLVDAWRKMGFYANALKAGVDLTTAAGVGTLNNNAARFDSRTGFLKAGLRFDTPLNRLAERNSYREAQIDYQRARRDFMLFEDKISQSLRNTLQMVEVCQLNFELRRAAVQVAISQVDLARLRLEEPPRPGVVAQIGATTARDLVTALSDLLDAQNDFLSMRTGYEALRLVLDFESGTMQTDADGLWIDPGAITASGLRSRVPRWRSAPVSAPTASSMPVAHALSFRQEQSPTVR